MDTTEFIIPGISVNALVIMAGVFLIALILPYVSNWLAKVSRRAERAFRYLVLAVYAAGNLYETLLFRVVTKDPKYKLRPLWSYREAIRVTRVVEVTNAGLLDEIILNILLYIPLGYLLPYVFRNMSTKKAVLIGLLCSAVTELTQLIFKLGLFEFDDMINNTLGAAIGAVLYSLWIRKRLRASCFHGEQKNKGKADYTDASDNES